MKATYMPQWGSVELRTVSKINEQVWIACDQFTLILHESEAATLVMQLTDALNPPSTEDAVKRIDFAKVASEVTPD